MRIKKMSASFGALQNSRLELDGGLNIVYAPNETGKSTWCAFILAMLYGINTSEKERAGYKPDKIKYAPWSGSPMEGSMDIEFRGRDITLKRWTRRASAPMKEFSAVYTGTADEVPGLNSSDAGETITGVPKGVFERSAFIRQADLAVSGSPELERRISAIVSTGEEDSSFTEAESRLRAWQRKRRHNKYGALPELESRMSETRQRLKDMKDALRERWKLEEALESAQARREELFREVEESRKLRRREVLNRIAAIQNEIREKQQAAIETQAEAGRRREELAQSLFGTREPGEVEKDVRQDLERASALRARAGKRFSPLLWIIPAVLCAAALAAGFLWEFKLFIAGGLLLAAAAALFVRVWKNNKASGKALEELKTILDKYSALDVGGISEALSRHRELWSAWQEARERAEKASSELEAARERQKQADKELLGDLDFTSGDTEAAYLTRKLASAEEEVRSLREMAAAARGRLEAQGDPMVLESELRSLKSRHRELTEQYEALDLAVNVLREAGAEIQSRFSPRLSRRATELMAGLTGGRYDELALDRELSARARRVGDMISRETVYLSKGTLDQLYLALRLAICELALESDEPCPIILDDSLVNFDEERMGLALELLLEMANSRQIILFTCHRREAEYFSGKDRKNVSIITLNGQK
ncbi:MAG: ATP-binding protein [Oscillospiraceae bacterium]|jgi:DNA repair exonuclease SbcCD ATPase subunit